MLQTKTLASFQTIHISYTENWHHFRKKHFEKYFPLNDLFRLTTFVIQELSKMLLTIYGSNHSDVKDFPVKGLIRDMRV